MTRVSNCGLSLEGEHNLIDSFDHLLAIQIGFAVLGKLYLQSKINLLCQHSYYIYCPQTTKFILNQNVFRFSDDGEMIATSSDDGTIRLWDPDTGKEIHVFNEPKGFACHLDWHPSGSCIGKNFLKVLSGSGYFSYVSTYVSKFI